MGRRIVSSALTLLLVVCLIFLSAPVTATAVENTTVTVEEKNSLNACTVNVKKVSSKPVKITEKAQNKTQAKAPVKEVAKSKQAKKDTFRVLETVDGKTATALLTLEKGRCEYAPGVSVIDTIIEGIRVLFGGMKKTIVYLMPVPDTPYLEFIVNYYDNVGNHFVVPSGVYYDKENSLIFGKYDTGIYDSGFDFDVKNIVFFAARRVWQRAFGFCDLYDQVAQYITFDYVTKQVTFFYDGKDWKFQFWKGRYNAFIRGGEIGIYTKPPGRGVEFYDCADYSLMIPMSLKVSYGDYVYVDRSLETHWWMTGFKIGGPVVTPEKMTLEGALVLKNREMLELFTAALDEQAPEIQYMVDDLKVSIIWQGE